MLKILSTKERKLTDNEIKSLHQIMVKGYEITEEEIWGKNYVRLFLPEFKALIDLGNIYVAYFNNTIVGCISFSNSSRFLNSSDSFSSSIAS